ISGRASNEKTVSVKPFFFVGLVGTVFNVFLGLAGGFLAGLSFLTAMRFPPMIENFMNVKPVGVQHFLLCKTQRTKMFQRMQRK
ncbi:hypothetical protein, partial [Flagellimonas marinaquae]